MKRSVLVVFIIVFFVGAGVITYEDLKNNKTTTISNDDWVILVNNSESLWIPDEKTISEFELGLEGYLNGIRMKRNEPEVEFILNHLEQYKKQYRGLIVDNKRVLDCNFVLFDDSEESEFSNWKQQYIFVLDGGPQFFQIQYDVRRRKCFKLSINGFA